MFPSPKILRPVKWPEKPQGTFKTLRPGNFEKNKNRKKNKLLPRLGDAYWLGGQSQTNQRSSCALSGSRMALTGMKHMPWSIFAWSSNENHTADDISSAIP
jgi:hypothetical protein